MKQTKMLTQNGHHDIFKDHLVKISFPTVVANSRKASYSKTGEINQI